MEFSFVFSSIFLLLTIVDGFPSERYGMRNGERLGKRNKQENLHFTCLDGSRAIPLHFVCNGKFDCSDLSDEYLCPLQKRKFKNSKFSNVILSKFDQDDQRIGLPPTVVEQRKIIRQKFHDLWESQFADNAIDFSKRACIPSVLNPISGVRDPCVHCTPGEILCSANTTRLQTSGDHNGVCVQKSKVCDGRPDCAAEEDEMYCNHAFMSLSDSDIASKLNSSNRNGSRMMYNHQKSDTFRQILALSTSFHNRTNFNRINYSITDRENQLNFPVRNDRKNITITCTQLSRGLKGIFKDEEWILNRTNLFPPIGPPPYGFPPPFGLSNRFHNRIAPHLSVFGLSNIPHGEEQGIGMSTPGWPHFPPAFSRGRFPPPFIRQKIVDIFLNATNNMTTDPWRDGLIPIPLPLQLGNSENHIPSGHLPPPTAVDELFRMFSNIPLVIEGTTQDHISSGQYCDGVIDCSSREDEMSCPGRFYCESGNTIYVDRTAVMDGVADCADESDEWPEDYAESTMASKDSMIKDWPLRLLMWTIGIVSVLGNSMVIITNLRNFITVSKNGKLKRATTRFMSSISCKEKQQETLNSRRKSMGRTHTGASIKISERQRIIKLWNRGLVLNLALADFLMGVYLLSLASVSISKQEGYWAFDKIWRTSISCQLLGMIVMISSQTSMYTLVALTTLRLYTVVRPFSVAYLQKKNLWIFCIIAWMTSIFLAVLPSAPHVKYYFASVAWVPFPHFRPPVLDLVHADEFVRTLADLTGIPLAESLQESQMSWWNVVDYVDQVSPAYYSNWKFFGFYSAHSVCIPKLYVTTDDVGWWYTVAFLCLIFIAVLYMGIAYSIIYFHSTSILRASTSNSNVTDKEKGTKAISVCDSCETSLHASHNPDRNTIQYPRLKLLLDYITCRKARNNADDKTKAKTITDDSRSSGSPSRITKSAYNTSEMQCRIALLIVTDCLCWIPICIMGFCKLAGYNIPGRAYSISAIGLLPVNSALNPLLYSRTIQEFWNKYYGLFKKYIFMCSTKNGV